MSSLSCWGPALNQKLCRTVLVSGYQKGLFLQAVEIRKMGVEHSAPLAKSHADDKPLILLDNAIKTLDQ